MNRLERMAVSDRFSDRMVAAQHPQTPRRFLAALIVDDDVRVRRAAIKNHNVTARMLELALHDQDMGIVAYAKQLKWEDDNA